jgi:hypothetical protein
MGRQSMKQEDRLRGQIPVGICFSLWRAAFLADKTGQGTAVFASAKDFLGKILVDNAINYTQIWKMTEQ